MLFYLMYMTTISVSVGFVNQLIEDGMKDSSSASFFMSLSVIFCGCMFNWFMLSPLKEPFLSYDMKFSPLIFIFMSIFLMYLWSFNNFLFKGTFSFLLLNFSYYMWFLVPNSSQMMMQFPLSLSKKSLMIDQGWLEMLGPSGIYMKKYKYFKYYVYMIYYK